MSAGAISRLQLWQAGRRVLSTSLLAAICIALLHCLAIGAEEFGLARDNESDGDHPQFSSLYHGGTNISDEANTVGKTSPIRPSRHSSWWLRSRPRRGRHHRSRQRPASRWKPKPESELEVPESGICGKLPSYDTGSFRIIHGKRAKLDEWPFVIHLHNCKGENCASCTGSILNEEWIVTAAHCVEDGDLTTIIMTFRLHGLEDLRNPEAFGRRAGKIIAHENYDTSTLLNDVALIKLAEPLTFNEGVQPICLTDQEDTVRASRNQECYNIGYGMVGDSIRADYLQKNPVEVKEDWECNGFNSVELISNTICIGPRRGRRGSSCGGDSGGPIACYDERNESWTLRGMVSYGPMKCNREYGVSWNTVSSDAGKFRHWIKWTMNNN